MRTRVRQIQTFTAIGEQGRRHQVIETLEEHQDDTISGPTEWMPGLRALRLATGAPVNELPDGTLEVVTTGERLARA